MQETINYKPASIALFIRVLDLKTRGCVFDSRSCQPKITNGLSDETLN